MQEYLTEDEIAEKLKVSRTTLWQLRKDGMPFVRVRAGIRYKPSTVEEWLEKQITTNKEYNNE